MPSLISAPLQAGSGDLAAAADIAVIVIAAAILVVAVLAGILVIRANRAVAEIQALARSNFGPVSDRARSISDNVDFITQSVRTDVQALNDSVSSLNDRLLQASSRMEERIEDFNALMEVVQGEAETLFLDTAATVRGVREGARVMGTPAIAMTDDVESVPTPEVGLGASSDPQD